MYLQIQRWWRNLPRSSIVLGKAVIRLCDPVEFKAKNKIDKDSTVPENLNLNVPGHFFYDFLNASWVRHYEDADKSGSD